MGSTAQWTCSGGEDRKMCVYLKGEILKVLEGQNIQELGVDGTFSESP